MSLLLPTLLKGKVWNKHNNKSLWPTVRMPDKLSNRNVITVFRVLELSRVWVGRGWLWLCRQVAVSEPGTDVFVQRQLAEGQTHRHAAEEPRGAAQVCQRQRAVIRDTNEMDFLFDTFWKKVCNKDVFHMPQIVDVFLFLPPWIADRIWIYFHGIAMICSLYVQSWCLWLLPFCFISQLALGFMPAVYDSVAADQTFHLYKSMSIALNSK